MNRFIEHLEKLNPFDKRLLILVWLILFDIFILNGIITVRIISIGRQYQNLAPLVLSGLLVLLYREQYRVQRTQNNIMQQQTTLQERQMDIQKARQEPELRPLEWSMEVKDPPNEEAIATDKYISVSGKLINEGSGRAINIRFENTFYFRQNKDELLVYDFSIGGMMIPEAPLFTKPSTLDYMLSEREGGILRPRTESHVMGIAGVVMLLWRDKPEPYEDRPGGTIPVANFDKLYKNIDECVYDVDSILLETNLVYTNAIGDGKREFIRVVERDADEINSLEDIVEEGNRIGKEAYSVAVKDHPIGTMFDPDTLL